MKDKKIFWVRLGLFILFGLIIPVGFIIWRYELFTKVNRLTFGVWGIIALIIILVFGGVCYKYIVRGLVYSYALQIIGGVVKVIVPCLFIWLVSYELQDSIDLFIQVMGVITISEMLAIIVNPFPKWVYEHRTEHANDLLNIMFDKWEGKTK